MANNASDFLAQARKDIGYSRWNDPETGTKYGRFFRDVLGWGSYYANNGVPYCGMAVSYWAYYAGVKCPGLPGAYTPDMAAAGVSAGRSVNKSDMRPGDVVYFDWELNGEIDHVGLCESFNGSYASTIEGNTNNGQVCRRNRDLSTIVRVIRPNFDGSSSSTPSTPSGGSSSSSSLVRTAQEYLRKWGYDLGSAGVDGEYGPASKAASVRYLQYNLGYYGKPVVVDGEYGPETLAAYKSLGYLRSGYYRTYIIKAIQITLMLHGVSVGGAGIDGEVGSGTLSGVRMFQSQSGLTADAIVGPDTMQKLFG